jgi:hypothetical protein
MTVVNNSAPRTHPNDKSRYIQKSGMSRDHTRTGSRLWVSPEPVFGGRGGGETLWNRLQTQQCMYLAILNWNLNFEDQSLNYTPAYLIDKNRSSEIQSINRW